MTDTPGAEVVFEATGSGDDYLDFQPLRVSQRVIAAAMAIAFVPIAALLLRFAMLMLVGWQGDGSNIWEAPLWTIVMSVLNLTTVSFVFSWLGFAFLVPITHRRRPERFLKSWLLTCGLGAGVGGGIGLLLALVFAMLLGVPEIGVLVPVCAAYGALFAFVYWVFCA